MDSNQGCCEEYREALVDFLYDEGDAAARARITSHVEHCSACAAELEAMRSVRGALTQWEDPEPVMGLRVVAEPGGLRPWWQRMLRPAWGLAAAAVLVFVVAAAVASFEVRYDADGFLLRMGPVEQSDAPLAVSTEAPVPAARDAEDATPPWHADLARLEDELQRAVTWASAAAPATLTDTDLATLRAELQHLISQSERRQQQEVAIWFTEFAREFDMLRRADQERLQQEFVGAFDGVTDYLYRVSQR